MSAADKPFLCFIAHNLNYETKTLLFSGQVNDPVLE